MWLIHRQSLFFMRDDLKCPVCESTDLQIGGMYDLVNGCEFGALRCMSCKAESGYVPETDWLPIHEGWMQRVETAKEPGSNQS